MDIVTSNREHKGKNLVVFPYSNIGKVKEMRKIFLGVILTLALITASHALTIPPQSEIKSIKASGGVVLIECKDGRIILTNLVTPIYPDGVTPLTSNQLPPPTPSQSDTNTNVTPKLDLAKISEAGESRTVYVVTTDNGKKYHYYRDCSTLVRSKEENIQATTIEQAKEMGYLELCKVCEKR